MVNRRKAILLGSTAAVVLLMSRGMRMTKPAEAAQNFAVMHTDAEWHKLLTPAQYNILRDQGTEMPFTSKLLDEHRKGVFACAGCALPLFASDKKYDSGTGWPSFWAPLPDAIQTTNDMSMGMERTEVHCMRCGSHLGHVFPDGPQPTGMRYCMDGLALTFTPA